MRFCDIGILLGVLGLLGVTSPNGKNCTTFRFISY